MNGATNKSSLPSIQKNQFKSIKMNTEKKLSINGENNNYIFDNLKSDKRNSIHFQSIMGKQRLNLDMITPIDTYTDKMPINLTSSGLIRKHGYSAKTNKSIKNNYWYNHRMTNSTECSKSFDISRNNDSVMNYRNDLVSKNNYANKVVRPISPKNIKKQNFESVFKTQLEETYDEWYFLNKNNTQKKKMLNNQQKHQDKSKKSKTSIMRESIIKPIVAQEHQVYRKSNALQDYEADAYTQKEEINLNILDDLVLKDIKKNGLPIGDKKSNRKKVVEYGNLNLNSNDTKYFLSLLYQEKCKKFNTLSHLQGQRFNERSNNQINLGTKVKNLFATRSKNQTKKEYKRELGFYRKKYWEYAIKIKIKIQFMKKLSEMIVKKQGIKMTSYLEDPDILLSEVKLATMKKTLDRKTITVLKEEQLPKGFNQHLVPELFENTTKVISNRSILRETVQKADEKSLENLIQDFENMTQRLQALKIEKKYIKLKLRKICKFLLMNLDIIFKDELTPQEVIIQLWEINEKINKDMFSPQFDESSKDYYLKMSALEKSLVLSHTTDEFFNWFIVESLRSLSEKLESIIDFSAEIECESMDLLKLAFFDFYKKVEKAEVPASRKSLSLILKKTNDKTMQIWEKVQNTSLDILENSRNALLETNIKPFLMISIKNKNLTNSSKLETEIRLSKKYELERIEKQLYEIDFSVDYAFNNYKQVRSIEGEKNAGVRILKAVNCKIEKMLEIGGSLTYKKSLQNELQKLLSLINNDKRIQNVFNENQIKEIESD